jgi:hypothetical protein
LLVGAAVVIAEGSFLCAAPLLGTSDPSGSQLSCLLAAEVDVPGAGLP